MSAVHPVIVPAGTANPQRALILFVCMPVAAFMIFGITLALDYEGDRYPMIGLALLTTVIALIPVILDQSRPAERRHMLLTFYCILFIGHFALPIFTQYAVVSMPTDPPGVSYAALFPSEVVAGQAVILVGLVAFLLGYAVLRTKLSDEEIKLRAAKDWPPAVIPIIAVMMLMLGWTVVISSALGLIPRALGSGVISTIGSSVVFGNALLALAAIRHRSRFALLLLCFAVPISSGLGFFTGSKTSTLIVPTVVVFTSMLLGGRFRARWMLIGTVALMLLYPLSEFYRGEVLRQRGLNVVSALSDPIYTLGLLSNFLSSSSADQYLTAGLKATAGRMDGIGIASVIVRDTPSVSPFQMGRTLALFPVAFVPRLLWPDKPSVAIGRWITSIYGTGDHVDSHTGPSFLGDLYLNFGVASVGIGMFIMGIVLRLFQVRFLGPNPNTIGILAAIVVIVQVHLKQIGSAAYVMSSTVFALAPVFIVYFAVPLIVGRRNARPLDTNWSEQGDSGVGAGS